MTMTNDHNQAANLFIENILGAFSRSVSDRMDEAVVDAAGLSSSACYAIVTIGSEPGSSIETLRHFLDVEHSSLVRLLNGLEKKGLILRSKSDGNDKRTVRIDLSPEGETCFTKILDARHSVLNKAVGNLGEHDKEMLFRLISRMMPVVVKPGDDQHYVCRLCDLELCPQEICPVNLAHPEHFELPDTPFRRRCNSRIKNTL